MLVLAGTGVGCATSSPSETPVSHESALRAKLEQARALRTSGHGDAALSVLDEALKMEARWAEPLPPDLRARQDEEVAGAADSVEAEIQADLSAGAPLAAQRRVAVLAPLMEQPPLHPARDRLQARLAEAGKTRCRELTGPQKGDTPYLARLLVEYCARVGGAFTAPAPADQARGLLVSGRIAHATDAQQKIVETWLAEVFRASPWYASDAADLSPVTVAGSYDARLERRWVAVTVPYRTTIHSTVTRGIAGLGPTAEVETETERTFEYEAERYDAHYRFDGTLTLQLGPGLALVVSVKHGDSKRAFEHDVRFPAANVYPQKANLPDVNAWLTTFLATKRAPMLQKLRARWVTAFCRQTEYSPDEAARCLQAGQRVPQAEHALRAVFGGDTQDVIDGLTRSRGDERKRPAAQTPEVEEVPAPGPSESI
ncbi:MAG TPA: hypothetical protein VHO67_03725 [Polyangia bacterium]|nr:hypothetical protein [Polyangia bacterium]